MHFNLPSDTTLLTDVWLPPVMGHLLLYQVASSAVEGLLRKSLFL